MPKNCVSEEDKPGLDHLKSLSGVVIQRLGCARIGNVIGHRQDVCISESYGESSPHGIVSSRKVKFENISRERSID